MTTSAQKAAAIDRLQIDFLFLDLETCTRCRGTDQSLESALEVVHELLATTGTTIEINKIHVDTAQRAQELRFASSPTIRINGHDIALELQESSCGSEACTDGCGDSIACRVWTHAGQQHTEPPAALIVDAILREVYGGTLARPGPDARPYQIPENLRRFYAGKTAAAGARAPAIRTQIQAACCSPAEQNSCCDPEDKPECCGAATGGSCGCQTGPAPRPAGSAVSEAGEG
jgi:hypothetical protein